MRIWKILWYGGRSGVVDNTVTSPVHAGSSSWTGSGNETITSLSSQLHGSVARTTAAFWYCNRRQEENFCVVIGTVIVKGVRVGAIHPPAW